MRTQGKQKTAREVGSLGEIGSDFARTALSKRSLSKRPTIAGNQDPLYLFACHLDWHQQRNLGAYQALVAALDDSDKRIRVVAQLLLHRGSPRPQGESQGVLPE